MKNNFSKWNLPSDKQLISQFVCAGCIYLFASIYLYWPYLRNFSLMEIMFVINSAIASVGCFLVSRQWSKSFAACLLGGAIYAFGPFTLGFTAYHPLASIPATLLPWLLIPATILPAPKHLTVFSIAAKAVLYALPLVIIILFFKLLSQPLFGPFYPMPPIKATLTNFTPLVFPLACNPQDFVVSFYYFPLLAIVTGITICISSRIIPLAVLLAGGICVSFCKPVYEVPPIVWILLPVISCSILAAIGSEKIIRYPKSKKQIIVLSIIFYTACWADIISGAKYTLDQIFGLGF